MFADLDQINAAPQGSSSPAGAALRGFKVSAAEAPLKEEVAAKLQHLPPALLAQCQQVLQKLAIFGAQRSNVLCT